MRLVLALLQRFYKNVLHIIYLKIAQREKNIVV